MNLRKDHYRLSLPRGSPASGARSPGEKTKTVASGPQPSRGSPAPESVLRRGTSPAQAFSKAGLPRRADVPPSPGSSRRGAPGSPSVFPCAARASASSIDLSPGPPRPGRTRSPAAGLATLPASSSALRPRLGPLRGLTDSPRWGAHARRRGVPAAADTPCPADSPGPETSEPQPQARCGGLALVALRAPAGAQLSSPLRGVEGGSMSPPPL